MEDVQVDVTPQVPLESTVGPSTRQVGQQQATGPPNFREGWKEVLSQSYVTAETGTPSGIPEDAPGTLADPGPIPLVRYESTTPGDSQSLGEIPEVPERAEVSSAVDLEGAAASNKEAAAPPEQQVPSPPEGARIGPIRLTRKPTPAVARPATEPSLAGPPPLPVSLRRTAAQREEFMAQLAKGTEGIVPTSGPPPALRQAPGLTVDTRPPRRTTQSARSTPSSTPSGTVALLPGSPQQQPLPQQAVGPPAFTTPNGPISRQKIAAALPTAQYRFQVHQGRVRLLYSQDTRHPLDFYLLTVLQEDVLPFRFELGMDTKGVPWWDPRISPSQLRKRLFPFSVAIQGFAV